MAIQTNRIYTVQEVSQELTEVLDKFHEVQLWGQRKVVTKSGKEVEVSTVSRKNDNTWAVVNQVIRDKFNCENCKKMIEGNTTYQFKRTVPVRVFISDDSPLYQTKYVEKAMRLHDILIHDFQQHPNIVLDDYVQALGLMLLR